MMNAASLPVLSPSVALFDTHLHLDPQDDAAVLLRAGRQAGVQAFLVVATDLADASRAQALTRREPGVFATVGLHPHQAAAFDGDLSPYREMARQPGVVAIGEVGLDYHYEHAPRSVQRHVFGAFVELAAEAGLPLVVHCREAQDDCLAVLRERLSRTQKVELHSFTGTPAQAEPFLAMGACISFNGIVTFPKASNVRETLQAVPLDRLLVETDAPYLAPVPYRGRRNQPAYLIETVRAIAAARGLPVEELAAVTSTNGKRFFGLP